MPFQVVLPIKLIRIFSATIYKDAQFNVTKTPATKREKLKQKFEDTVPKGTNYTSGKRFESKFGENMQNLKKFSADKFSSFEGWDDFPKRQKFAFKRTNIPLDDSLPQGTVENLTLLKICKKSGNFLNYLKSLVDVLKLKI